MPDGFKTVPMTPLTGILDVRSTADQQFQGGFTWKKNVEVSPDGKLRQARGFRKPYGLPMTSKHPDGTPCPYLNWDFHEQGVATPEPPTLLFQSTSNDGVRRLFLATKTRIGVLDETAGSWAIIGTGYGSDSSSNQTAVRFRAAELQDKVFFTNGFDKVQYHELGSSTVQEVSSLNNAGSGGTLITKAKVIVQYQGVIMLMNVEEGGTRIASRIWWSDLNKGTEFNQPDISSISDYQDLDYGEQILAAITLQGYLYVFTNISIWRCSFTVDTQNNQATLNCAKIYTEPKSSDKCLAYPNTLISDGSNLYWASYDSIYSLNVYQVVPERPEWIYRACGVMYEGDFKIDPAACGSPVVGYRPITKEIFISWPVVDAELINWTECVLPPTQQSSGLNRHTLVLNVGYSTADYRDHGFSTFINFNSDAQKIGDCNNQKLFLAFSASDFCMKLFDDIYYREMYDRTSQTYTATGYIPQARGVFPFGKFDVDKQIKRFVVDGFAEKNAGNNFYLRIGTSYHQMNPNDTVAGCAVIWYDLAPNPVKCLMTQSADAYKQANVRPSYDHKFNFLYRGRFLYFDLSVKKADGSAPNDGGVVFSRFEVMAIEA